MRGANWAHRPRQLTIALRFWRMRGVGVAGPIFNHKVPCRPTPNCHVPGQRAGTVGCLHGDNQLHGGNRRLVPICRQLVMQRKQLLHEGRVLCSRAEQRQRGGAAVWHGNDRIMRRQCYVPSLMFTSTLPCQFLPTDRKTVMCALLHSNSRQHCICGACARPCFVSSACPLLPRPAPSCPLLALCVPPLPTG